MTKQSLTLSVENLESRFNLSSLAGAAPLGKLVPLIADPSLAIRATSLQETMHPRQITPISLTAAPTAPTKMTDASTARAASSAAAPTVRASAPRQPKAGAAIAAGLASSGIAQPRAGVP